MEQTPNAFSRRRFLQLGAAAGFGSALSLSPFISLYGQEHPERKLGVALAGLGSYSAGKLAPALKVAQYCQLTGIVTGTPAKAEKWSKDYGIAQKNIYDYRTFDRIADNPDIDVVYIVLPNGMHAEFTIRAAQAGKHVICEKPMANSVAECRQMIDACRKAGVKLQIGYRCQYDPHHREVMSLGQEEKLGKVLLIEASNAFCLNGPSNNWRYTDKALAGGGAMMDMGVYCIQGVRYTKGKEPIAITARKYISRPEIFKAGLEETIIWQMEFADGSIGACTTGYGSRSDFLKVSAEKGNFDLQPCYQYTKPELRVNGKLFSYDSGNQQAVQMDAFARNILDDTAVIASGEEGLRDLAVVEAAYRSAAEEGRRTLVERV